jgi:hypothetical protein
MPLHLDNNGAFTCDSECAFHFIWALAWTPTAQSVFFFPNLHPLLCTAHPSLNHIMLIPLVHALQAHSVAAVLLFVESILKLLVPLPPMPSPAAAGDYACWHLKYMARQFALMRRVSEAPSPVTARQSSLPFNESAVLRRISPSSLDSESKCERLRAHDKSNELREWAQTCNLKHMSPKVNRDHRNVSSEHMS